MVPIENNNYNNKKSRKFNWFREKKKLTPDKFHYQLCAHKARSRWRKSQTSASSYNWYIFSKWTMNTLEKRRRIVHKPQSVWHYSNGNGKKKRTTHIKTIASRHKTFANWFKGKRSHETVENENHNKLISNLFKKWKKKHTQHFRLCASRLADYVQYLYVLAFFSFCCSVAKSLS